MMAAIKHFDVLSFVKKSKELGVSEQVAEYQARQIEQAIDIAVSTAKEEIHIKDLATKHDTELIRKDVELVKADLRKEIVGSRNQVVLWVVTIVFGSGLIQHFFK